jgi:hypothetical protein
MFASEIKGTKRLKEIILSSAVKIDISNTHFYKQCYI